MCGAPHARQPGAEERQRHSAAEHGGGTWLACHGKLWVLSWVARAETSDVYTRKRLPGSTADLMHDSVAGERILLATPQTCPPSRWELTNDPAIRTIGDAPLPRCTAGLPAVAKN